jgi:predicted tellurium resistance membrane protein TerC
MSLDNILAIAGVAHGNIALLLFGLIVSMPLILFGSGLIALIMNRMPWLAYLGAGILTWTAGQMVAEDRVLSEYLHAVPAAHWLLPIIATIAILAPFLVRSLLLSRRQSEPAGAVAER